jgi:hypothetical protein
MRIHVLFVATCLGACTRREPAPSTHTAPVATVVDTPVEPAPPRVYGFTTSGVRFTSDILDVCVDITVTSENAGASEKLTTYEKAMRKDGINKIGKDCEDSFRQRTALASCTVSKEHPDHKVVMQEQHFRFDAVGLSDRAMKECIESAGTWKQIDQNSREWRLAKLEHSRRNLQKISDKLAKASAPSEEEF